MNGTLLELIEKWNNSDRDASRQKETIAAFDNLMEFCEVVKGTAAEDQEIPRRFFPKFFRK